MTFLLAITDFFTGEEVYTADMVATLAPRLGCDCIAGWDRGLHGWRMHWGDWVMPRPIYPRDLYLDEELHSRIRQGIPRRFATAPPGLEASGLMTESAVKAYLDAFLEFGKILKLGVPQHSCNVAP